VAARKSDGRANRTRLPSIGFAVHRHRRNRHQMIGAKAVQEPQRECRNRQRKKRHRDEL
jgi:hypothetical protein